MNDLEYQLEMVIKECERLKKENEELRKLLHLTNEPPEHSYVLNINRDTVTKRSKVEEKIRLYHGLFKGRPDVFALRWESKSGKSGYSPACDNEWKPILCDKPKIKCAECQNRKFVPFSDKTIYEHLMGKKTVGIYPLLKDNTCWFLAVDFDKLSWRDDVSAFLEICKEYQVPAYIEKSRSGEGCHLWIFFNKAISATLARKLGSELLTKTLEKRYDLGVDSFDRFFPNQDTMPKGGFGNLIALPLQRQPAYNGNSVFVNDNFEPYPDQWLFLSSVKKMDVSQLSDVINKLNSQGKEIKTSIPYPKHVEIKLRNGLFIKKNNLPSEILNKLIQIGTFNNPEFYKAQKQRLPLYGIPRKINCTENHEDYLILPRGCYGDVKKVFDDLTIKTVFLSEQNEGKSIDITFNGQLTTNQLEAETALLNHVNGILAAATGFGKTVIAASMIAKRKVNTLIIVHRKQLMEQWLKKLVEFYHIDPKSIGRIGGGKNKATGIIDIATIQSLNYKGKVKDLVRQYGQIIVDECHHISAFSFEQVLKEAQAKFVYGLTATPTRKDGLHPIIFMQLGPVRYKVSAKSQAKKRPFEHILIPRNTGFKSQLPENQKVIQNLYDEIVHSEERNSLIFDDVLKALDCRRSPIIITERVDHVEKLRKAFTGFVKNLFILTGGMNNKDSKLTLERIKEVPKEEERLIIATGKYIGEGFDDSRLDTLFLTMPISWKGTLNQYTGRLHRLNYNKQVVQVYDYIDEKEPIFEAMYNKRLQGYKTIGYQIATDTDLSFNEQMQLF